MMPQFPQEFVLFDLEYTAWPDSKERRWEGQDREIIQIGAIRVRAGDLSEIDAFLAYVQPHKNPVLSDFIIELTGITQEDVDRKGVPFKDAFAKFKMFVGDTTAYCWGKDTEVFEENCSLIGEPLTLPRTQFINIKPLIIPVLESAGIDESKYSSGTLIQAFGKDTGRRAHDAVNDMRNLLDAICELRAQVQ